MSAAAPQPDRPELTELVSELGPALAAWAQLRLPTALRGMVVVDDIVQEVWLRIVRIYATSFRPERSSPRAWVFAVAKLVLLEVERAAGERQQREPAPGGTSWQRSVGELPAQITSLTQKVASDERIARFVARMQELDEDDRRLLLFCGVEAMPQVEAARRLGLSEDVAAKRWQRLRARVQTWGAAQELLAS
jgi:RNA polymerase sigma factor (sigma-70 family)